MELRSEIADFLRSRRAPLRPEEVAVLAAIPLESWAAVDERAAVSDESLTQ